MQSFIEDVIAACLEEYDDLSLVAFIVPSRRAGNFLRTHIAQHLEKSIFSPEIYSIEEFIEYLSGLKQASQTDQIFALYQAYLKITPPKDKESFSIFYGWAQTLLGDFNEIDRYLVDHSSFFDYLSAIQDLNHWSKEQDATSLVKNYLKFWKLLPEYYTLFTSILLDANTAHQGLIYRKAAEDIEHYIDTNKSKKHVFLGFNALNTSEQHLIQALLATGNSKIYWDTASHFMENTSHEASLFMREHKKNWPYFKTNAFETVYTHYNEKKEITITEVTQGLQLAKYIGNHLTSYTKEQLNETVLVLGDETLLLPIINALPKNIKNINVTMGIPLRQTPPASLFEHFFTLKKEHNQKGFYYKNVITLLQQPLIQKMLLDQAELIIKAIQQSNTIYIKIEDLQDILVLTVLPETLLILFELWEENPTKAIDNCLSLIHILKNTLDPSQDALNLEYLYGFYKTFNKLNTLNKTHSYIEDIPTFIRFYRDTISSETIDLQGDPHQGLQIMGMLESRLLDFKYVILTSLNEGILPAGKSNNSYIPYDLKYMHKLPTYQEKDAVYAYHFYRLLHRSEHIHLIYTSATEGIGTTEKSRFILQLELEGIHPIHQEVATPAIRMTTLPIQSIPKTDAVLQSLKKLFASGLSPSSLGTYLRNPLEFYYKYVLGIKELDEVEEIVAANTMGTIIHNVLEYVYQPYVNTTLTVAHIEAIENNIEPVVKAQFDLIFKSMNLSKGKNLIIYEVIQRYLINFLAFEKQCIQRGDRVQITQLEQRLKTPLVADQLSFPTMLKGTADRVEIRNDEIRIIDYKSGSVQPADLSIKEWDDLLLPEGKYEKAFQVLLYTYMLYKTGGISFPAKAGIISFKKLKNGFMPFKFGRDANITEETLLEFEKVLTQLICEIGSQDVVFEEYSS
ncbi:PD-(D/E)XK nuclease family protein [uncultured Dokdonia sp.]|mgnify:CR=1 FL=1|uniref:PD-(D/E)XK nuclease family protein n=1 Tax=uncultured Dokdonia sp. TaxID=575653 RepID=UPI0026194C78|nr:PD-(D/E)XK nuclease family protein [uncultured Dokdonia sp.]